MKTIFLLFAVSIATTSVAQEQVTFARKYALGDRDRYKISLGINSSQGRADLTTQLDQVVKQVHEDQTADVQMTFSGTKLKFAGISISNVADPHTAVRKTPSGGQVSDILSQLDLKAGYLGVFQSFATVAPGLFEFGKAVNMQIGKPMSLEALGVPAGFLSGSVLLKSIHGGVANVTCDVKVVGSEIGGLGVKIDSRIDVATSRLLSASANLSGKISLGEVQISSLAIRMDRVKA